MHSTSRRRLIGELTATVASYTADAARHPDRHLGHRKHKHHRHLKKIRLLSFNDSHGHLAAATTSRPSGTAPAGATAAFPGALTRITQ